MPWRTMFTAAIQTTNETKSTTAVYTYYVDATIAQVIADLQEVKGYTSQQAYNLVYNGGLTIETAQDPAVQQIMDEETSNEDNYPAGSRIGLEYALTVVKPDGTQTNYSKEMMEKYFRENESSSFELLFDSKEDAQAHIDTYKAAVSEEGDKIYETINMTVQPQISMVVMDQSTGYVKGIVGGRGEKTESLSLNRATDTTRQPGSTFKVVAAYAAALDPRAEPWRPPSMTRRIITTAEKDVRSATGTVRIIRAGLPSGKVSSSP